MSALPRAKVLVDANLVPDKVRSNSLTATLTAIEDFTAPVYAQIGSCSALSCGSKPIRDKVSREMSQGINDLKLKVARLFIGVCLDCLEAGGKYEGTCRFQHEK